MPARQEKRQMTESETGSVMVADMDVPGLQPRQVDKGA
jgi:hypothetical protein